ncbi:hypothetical protein GCM10011359_13370 [Nesterenkonia alkaliphila]|nr:hypothetical protein GCM10011359_13370 [Nesterenkonia alkaliphila]
MADGVDLASPTGSRGTWEQILAKLQARADAEGPIDWTVSVDSTAARAHQRATNITRHTGGFVELHESWDRAP